MVVAGSKQAVMDDQQVGLGLDGLAHGGKEASTAAAMRLTWPLFSTCNPFKAPS